jgi:hypothetical protein
MNYDDVGKAGDLWGIEDWALGIRWGVEGLRSVTALDERVLEATQGYTGKPRPKSLPGQMKVSRNSTEEH